MNLGNFMEAIQNLWVYRGPNQEMASKDYMETLSGYNSNWKNVFNQLKIKHKTTSWPTIGSIVDIALTELSVTDKPVEEKHKVFHMTEEQIFTHPIGQGCLKKGIGLALSDFVGKNNRFPDKAEGKLLKPFKVTEGDKAEFRGEFLRRMLNREKWATNKEAELKAKYMP